MAYPLVIQWIKNLQSRMSTVESSIDDLEEVDSELQSNLASFSYGTCVTDTSSPTKVAVVSGFQLSVGSGVAIKFSNANTASNPTLNVNSTGAKPIQSNGSNLQGNDKKIQAGMVATFRYDGINWNLTNPYTAPIDTPIAVSKGGTGIDVNPSMVVNLSSTSPDTVFESNPSPGVSGVLDIEHGGTGTSDGTFAGNASTATNATSAGTSDKLTTARNITISDNSADGIEPFDGTSDITLGIPVTVTAGTAGITLPTSGSPISLRSWLTTARNNLAWLMARFNSSGSALTAVSASTLSTVLPISKGGTGVDTLAELQALVSTPSSPVIITTNTTWTTPTAGLYHIIAVGGGSTWGGGGSTSQNGSGGCGATVPYTTYIEAGTVLTITIGAGGAGNSGHREDGDATVVVAIPFNIIAGGGYTYSGQPGVGFINTGGNRNAMEPTLIMLNTDATTFNSYLTVGWTSGAGYSDVDGTPSTYSLMYGGTYGNGGAYTGFSSGKPGVVRIIKLI